MEGYVLGIAIHREERGPMIPLPEVSVSVEAGLDGDFRGKGGNGRWRQVTAILMTDWLAVHTELKSSPFPPWWMRRANLCLQGISFGPEMVGKQLHFAWNGVILVVTGELTPCERMDEVTPSLREALTRNWRGGIALRVMRPGRIQRNESFRY